MHVTIEMLFMHVPEGADDVWWGWYSSQSGLTLEALKPSPVWVSYSDDMVLVADNVVKVYFTYDEYTEEYVSHIITYVERRLTLADECDILDKLKRYWDIPF